jgi:chemotaxis protein methyltransferase CheR
MSAPPPNDLLEHFSRFVETRLGLHFPPPRWPDLERGLRAAGTELGFEDPLECAAWILESDLTRKQLEVLAAHLTVGETYFFRGPRAFELLEFNVLPELISARRNGDRRMRIWAAGCCTGEEVYSIAITLSRVLPDLRDWQLTILGTDVNPRFLAKAVAGIYTRWSFRGRPDLMNSPYFCEVGRNRFAIAPEIRRLVTFSCLNLADDAYPSLTRNTNAMDIIFCRNVLMYFSSDQARAVVAKLHDCLLEGGYLFVSPVESSPKLFAEFDATRWVGAVVYRKSPAGEQPSLPQVLPRAHAPSPAGAFEPRDETRVIGTTCEPALPSLGEARQLANEGRLDEALAAADRILAANKLDAAAHYLRGLVQQEQGVLVEAAASMRRALFLNADFAAAQFALGHILHRLGRAGEARRCFANVRSLLRAQQPTAILPHAEGMTAGRLLAIVSDTEESMP